MESDLRRLLSPHTASRLRESARNGLRDFVDLAGPLGVTHFFVLTATPAAAYLRVARPPRGPTIAFRIDGYALARDVLAAQARPRAPEGAFKTPPLVVLNNFGAAVAPIDENAEGEASTKKPKPAAVGGGDRASALALAASLLRGAFPAIDVRAAKLATCQRVVLLSHGGEGRVSLRHYSISARPSGVSAGVRDLVHSRKLPADLAHVADAADILAAGGVSESEGEDNRVELGTSLRRAGAAGAAARVRLHELGPRLELTIVKAEAGLCGGAVLYHAHEVRGATAVRDAAAARATKEKGRIERRREQEANVARKTRAEEEKKEAAKAAAAAKAKSGGAAPSRPAGATKRQWWATRDPDAAPASDDDDVAAYREAVGADPESLAGLTGRRKTGDAGGRGGRGGGRGRGVFV